MAQNRFIVTVYDDHFVVGPEGIEEPFVVFMQEELGARLKNHAGIQEKKPRKPRKPRAKLPDPPVAPREM